MSQADFEYLGPYKVDRILGRGGMGTVYKGIHVKSGAPVAVKVIATGVANQVRFRRRFAAEVETLKRLKHPNIVALLGYGEEQGLLFYSMEYVEGHSLHDHLRQHQRMPWEDVVQIGIETTAALKHAHDIGIIHRDLKPANLMLGPNGQVKLTDFGIAKLFGSTDMTAAGSVIGTADFMPPEQAEGKPVTVRSDLYSLGGLLYALLAGMPPFGGKSVPEVLYAVRYNAVPELEQFVEGVPPELAELIYQLLSKDPQKRPPTALVVGNRLKSMQQGMQRRTASQLTGEADQPPEEEDDTKIGPQLTSLDLSDVEDDELKLTEVELADLGVNGTNDSDTQRGGTHVGGNPEDANGVADNDHAAPGTRAASPDVSDPEASDPNVSEPKGDGTHIAGVDPDADRSSSTRVAGSADPQDEVGTREKQTMVAPVNYPAPSPQTRESAGLDAEEDDEQASEFSAAGVVQLPKESTNEAFLPRGGPSHFTSVSDDPQSADNHITDHDAVESGHQDWLHYVSIAGMITLLIGTIITIVILMQPPTADELYATVIEKVESGDDGQLLSARTEIGLFLDRFPEDPRADELQSILDDAELSQWTRILQRKASRTGGKDELTAIEQGFLECMQARSQDASLAKEKLTAFLMVFGEAEDLTRTERRLIELAEYAVEAAGPAMDQDLPAAVKQLNELIQSAEADMEGEELKSFYRDLLLLYDGKAWARDQMARIRRQLEQE